MARIQTLDVPDEQVLIDFFGDANGLDWHHRPEGPLAVGPCDSPMSAAEWLPASTAIQGDAVQSMVDKFLEAAAAVWEI